MRKYRPYTPATISELIDMLAMMMLSSPTFVDKTGYFPERNISSVFSEFNESLLLLRGRLGEERYAKLVEMSDQMRAHFEADPNDETEDARKGRRIIAEMEDLLKRIAGEG